MVHKKNTQSAPQPGPSNGGGQNFSQPESQERGSRMRRSSAKQQALGKEVRKITKYATLALCGRQALEELNDFNHLGPESEESDASGDELGNGPSETTSFSFRAVPVNGQSGPATAQTPIQYAQQETQRVPPKLTARSHHIAPPMPSVQRLHLSFGNQHQAHPPSPPINPVLLNDQGIGFDVQQALPPTPGGGPADPPPGTRYNSRTGRLDTISDLSIDNQYSSPTPLPRGDHMVINSDVPSSARAWPTPSGVKRTASALATPDSLQVVQKVKIGDGGSRGCIRSSDFDGLYSAIVQLAVTHYHCILTNSSIYPSDTECRDWSAMAWNAACRANGVKIEYDEDAYKLITSRGSNLWSELKNLMRPLVEAEYGFVNEKTPDAIKSNAALALAVLTNHKTLTYKDRQQCKGAFEADIIMKGMIKWCYDKKGSMGIRYPSYFKDEETGGATLGIIIALLTAACVMEWTSGTRLFMKFNKEQYAAVFQAHYDLLVRFHEGTKHAGIVTRICKRLLKHARRHASIPNDPIALGSIEHFTMDEFTAAAAEWEYRESESEDDGM
ncbi:hypothetical protein DFH29DRAFT_1008445 [Suillus ampliporus]|nr:hypothetical protein DFH29DRAFT_1008445 [Suillus ampliporus]